MPRKKSPRPTRRQRGSGSLSVNKTTGEIRVRLPADVDPSRRSKRFRPGQLDAARAYLAAALAPASDEPALPVSMSLRTWAGQWLELYVMDVRSPNTVRVYRSHLTKLEPEYATPIAEIRPLSLQRIIRALTPTVAPRTIAAIANVWRLMFEAAVQDEIIPRNPARRLTVPAIPHKPPARHVTAQEVAKLIPAIKGERFAAVWALMLGCGLRIGEILGLHREHVDRANQRIWVQWQWTNDHWRDAPKARNPHWTRVPSWAWAHLVAHLDAQPSTDVLVFQSPYQDRKRPPGEKPHPWARTTVYRDLDALVKRVGLDELRPHAGRHGLASHLMAHGVSPAVIAELLGNTPGVVLSTYSHSTDTGHARAAEVVDAYLSGEATEGQKDAEPAVMGAVRADSEAS